MYDGEFKVIVHNSVVHRFVPTYKNVNGKLPKSINQQELDDIKKYLVPVIEETKMRFGEFRVIVVNHCVDKVEPMFDYHIDRLPK